MVREDAKNFPCEGQRYRTLAALAKRITGSHMNRFRLFKLGLQW